MTGFVSPYNSLQQGGVRAKTPPDLIVMRRDPTATDFGFLIGQIWVNLGASIWALVGFSGPTTAVWVNLSTVVSGFTWNSEAGVSVAAVAANGYVLTNTNPVTVSLPVNASTLFGDTIKIIGLSGGFTVSQAANQQMRIGEAVTTLGVTGTAFTDMATFSSITLICVSVAGGVFLWVTDGAQLGNFQTT